MKTKEDYINILNSHASEIKSSFGVKSLSLFGSVARNEQQCDSDIDVFVDMQPNIVLIIKLKYFLEKKIRLSNRYNSKSQQPLTFYQTRN